MKIKDVEIPLTGDEKAKVVSYARLETGIIITLAIVLSTIPIYYYKAPVIESISVIALFVILSIVIIYRLTKKALKKTYSYKEAIGVVKNVIHDNSSELTIVFDDDSKIDFFHTDDVGFNKGDKIKIHFYYYSYLINENVIESIEVLQ